MLTKLTFYSLGTGRAINLRLFHILPSSLFASPRPNIIVMLEIIYSVLSRLHKKCNSNEKYFIKYSKPEKRARGGELYGRRRWFGRFSTSSYRLFVTQKLNVLANKNKNRGASEECLREILEWMLTLLLFCSLYSWPGSLGEA